jgi:hypothetical protein
MLKRQELKRISNLETHYETQLSNCEVSVVGQPREWAMTVSIAWVHSRERTSVLALLKAFLTVGIKHSQISFSLSGL